MANMHLWDLLIRQPSNIPEKKLDSKLDSEQCIAARTKPYESSPFYPNLSSGGVNNVLDLATALRLLSTLLKLITRCRSPPDDVVLGGPILPFTIPGKGTPPTGIFLRLNEGGAGDNERTLPLCFPFPFDAADRLFRCGCGVVGDPPGLLRVPIAQLISTSRFRLQR